MNSHALLLSKADQIYELAQILSSEKIIAFDTEFIRESTFFPIVEIIQIATQTQSWLVDARAFKKNYSEGNPQSFDPGFTPLLEVFKNPGILKIVHAAQGDQECLYTSFGEVASPIFDTALAGSLCGYGESIGLSKLLKAVLDVDLAKGHARTNWSVRPLPEQLIEYAHADVIYLVALAQELMRQLDQASRKAWAFELSAHWEKKALYQCDLEGIVQKLARGRRLDQKSFVALSGLVKWREERVRKLNLPRRWVADDQVLLDLAQVRPKDLTHLSAFRGLSKGELKNSGQAILEALHQNDETQIVAGSKNSRARTPSQEESQVLDLLRCYVGMLADRHKIGVKHLLNSSQLLALLRCSAQDSKELNRLGILTEEAANLIGEDLIAILKGQRALLIRANQIEIIKVTQV